MFYEKYKELFSDDQYLPFTKQLHDFKRLKIERKPETNNFNFTTNNTLKNNESTYFFNKSPNPAIHQHNSRNQSPSYHNIQHPHSDLVKRNKYNKMQNSSNFEEVPYNLNFNPSKYGQANIFNNKTFDTRNNYPNTDYYTNVQPKKQYQNNNTNIFTNVMNNKNKGNERIQFGSLANSNL